MLQIHVVVVCGCVMKVIEGFVCVCSGWKGLHSKKAGKSVTLQFRNKINILVFHFYPLLTDSELLILWRGQKPTCAMPHKSSTWVECLWPLTPFFGKLFSITLRHLFPKTRVIFGKKGQKWYVCEIFAVYQSDFLETSLIQCRVNKNWTQDVVIPMCNIKIV